MKMRDIRTGDYKSKFVLPAVFLLVFFTLFLLTGPQSFPDTATYLQMHQDREPLYPMVLLLFRTIFGDTAGLYAAVVFQNILGAISCYLPAAFLIKKFCLKLPGSVCVVGLLLVPHIITPLSSASGMILTNSILSEGITFSLYYLFVYCLIRCLLDNVANGSLFIAGYFLAFFNSLARGQMMIFILAWGMVSVFALLRNSRGKSRPYGRIFLILFITLLSFPARGQVVKTYNYFANDCFADNSGSGTTLLTSAMYSANLGDRDLIREAIKDERKKQLFDDIFLRSYEAELTYEAAEGGMISQAAHLEASHDVLKFEHVEKYMTWYANELVVEAGAVREGVIDAEAKSLAKIILSVSFPQWIYIYMCTMLSGFIRSVAVMHPLLNWYALLIYAAAIVLMVLAYRRKIGENEAVLLLLSLFLTMANVAGTSLVIMCLSRYMIYNMPFFYLAGFLLLRCFLLEEKETEIRK